MYSLLRDWVGSREGTEDGEAEKDGRAVGDDVGDLLGLPVGSFVGLDVGVLDGLDVGARVGLDVGDSVPRVSVGEADWLG